MPASNIDRLYSSEAYVTLGGRQSKAMANQLTTVSQVRLLNLAGTLSPQDMDGVERAVKVQLGLA